MSTNIIEGIITHANRFPVQCPVCIDNSNTHYIHPLLNAYAWWHCSKCDLRFSSPMQGGDSKYYQTVWSYSPKYAAHKRKKLCTIERTWEYQKILEFRRSTHEHLLDIGCGEGEFLFLAREKYGFEVTGVDFNEQSVNTAHKLYGLTDVICGSWPEALEEVGKNIFDRVTLFHVLEHLEDPVLAIRTATMALKPNGLLGIAVPSYRRKPALFAGERDQPPHHLTLWSEGALANAFRAAGLTPLSICRRPLLPEDFLIYWQSNCPQLRTYILGRLLWIIGRRILRLPVFFGSRFCSTSGNTLVGFAKKHP